MELKINKSADEALKQIEEKGYADVFRRDSRIVYKVGINFNSETKKIDDWKILN